ncbi:hypothetical protein EIN_355650 [Entamoeba invadens IP1]|uniref:Uncharacterized protein n=1 Tax=Entamoeba invadens IP1 TaxID=370355 RepID=L7FNT6_ENTIV|nr:hypothetical protein EIN_355650 [Entamoeba invadens IP1]ELP92544.1 hypothetical protein EIN_355650 [Entamoeba invadens IP1]|eukprot:XP_004259315.1 hypothetical protein EIN_355650 [Entamoeba invadens IP1]
MIVAEMRTIVDWLQGIDVVFLVAYERVVRYIKYLFGVLEQLKNDGNCYFEKLPFIREIDNSADIKDLKLVCISLVERLLQALQFRFANPFQKSTQLQMTPRNPVREELFVIGTISNFDEKIRLNEPALIRKTNTYFIPNELLRKRKCFSKSETRKMRSFIKENPELIAPILKKQREQSYVVPEIKTTKHNKNIISQFVNSRGHFLKTRKNMENDTATDEIVCGVPYTIDILIQRQCFRIWKKEYLSSFTRKCPVVYLTLANVLNLMDKKTRDMFPELKIIVEELHVIAATSCSVERSFSQLSRVSKPGMTGKTTEQRYDAKQIVHFGKPKTEC